MNESFFFTRRKKSVTLTEVNEYLIKYPALSIKTERTKDFDETKIFFTEHRYASGLIIYLKWQATTDYLEDEFPNINLLFTLRNRGFYVPKGFDILLPTEDVDYHALEFQTSSPLIYPDEVYLQLMKDIDSSLRFEMYYKTYKKNNKTNF